MNNLCADIGWKSINHEGEQLCGDHVDIVEQSENSTVIVLADGMGSQLGIGVGRGAAVVIMASGLLLAVMALVVYPIKAVRQLEKGEPYAGKNCVE